MKLARQVSREIIGLVVGVIFQKLLEFIWKERKDGTKRY